MGKTQQNIHLVACPQCHAMNRIPQDKLEVLAKCGKCGAQFTASEAISASPVNVTDTTFAREVLQSPLPVLVDFWAPWCGPCRMVAPLLDEFASEFAGRLKIAKLNTDESQNTAIQYQIQGIPTMLFVKDGQIVDRVVGAMQKPALHAKIQKFL